MATPYTQRPVSSGQQHYPSAQPIRVVVFGGTGVGKSSFVNDASRGGLEIGHGLRSSTKVVQAGPTFQLDGRTFQLYDTPGFDDTTMTDTEILRGIADFLVGMFNTGKRITGILYLHRIIDNRMSGASVRSFELFKEVCGLGNMRNAIIVTNMWSSPLDPEEERRDNQLREQFFRAALDNGARMARRLAIGSRSAHDILRNFLNLQPVELQLQNEIGIRLLPLDETRAGMLVDQNLRAKLARQEREKEELEEELAAAREERDRRTQDQLERFRRDREEEMRLLNEQLELLREDRLNMASARQGTSGPGMTRNNFSASELANEQATGEGSRQQGAFSRWTPRIFQAHNRPAGTRGREGMGAQRSAA